MSAITELSINNGQLEKLADRLYAGELLALCDIPAMQSLVSVARDIIRAEFGNLELDTAAAELSSTTFTAKRKHCEREFAASDPEQYFTTAFATLGWNIPDIFLDRVKLRILPASPKLWDARIRPLPPHRDTWASKLPIQLNWWMPVLELPEDSSLEIFPYYFERAIVNDSASWNFELLLQHLHRDPEQPDYPMLPSCQLPEPIPRAWTAQLKPANLLAFSGTHLHRSSPKPSAVRVNIDTRSVTLPDLLAGKGPMDVDGQAATAITKWFKQLGTGARLDTVLAQTSASCQR